MEGLSLSPDERVRIVRRRFGSARKLAEQLGVAHTTVSRVVAGKIRNEETQRRIAKACGQSFKVMFGSAA